MPEPTGDLREQLRAAIDDAGRHQVTIAADLGITTKHLCAMLTGRAKLTLEWAERIAEACGREVVVAIVDPDGDLRARLREVIRESHRSLVRTGRLAADVVTDAVLPVVQAETAALRQRAEEAERERDDYRQRFANQMTAATELTITLREAERKLQQALEAIADERRGRLAAEAAVRRAREVHRRHDCTRHVLPGTPAPCANEGLCVGCAAPWPCPTVAALDAEQPKETP